MAKKYFYKNKVDFFFQKTIPIVMFIESFFGSFIGNLWIRNFWNFYGTGSNDPTVNFTGPAWSLKMFGNRMKFSAGPLN